MNKFIIDSSYDFLKIYKLIVSAPEKDIHLVFSEDSSFYMNSSNLVVLKKFAEQSNKILTMETSNILHRDYMQAVNTDSLEIVSDEIDLNGQYSESESFINKISAKLGFMDMGKFFSSAMLKKTFKFDRKKSQQIDNILSTSSMNDSKSKKLKIGFTIAGVALFIGFLLYMFVVYFPKATVTLKINSNVFVKLIDAKADISQKSVDPGTFRIPAVQVSSIQSIELEADATGTKDIGEKAKGTVSITNKKNSSVKIKKNQIIRYSSDKNGKLNFLADEEIEIPAAETVVNPDTSSTTTFGKKDLKITAESFGEQYNVKSGEKFEINDQNKDDVYGVNSDKFTGGTKSQVKIITQLDIDNLKKSAGAQAKDKVQADLVAKGGSAQKIVESSIKISPKTETITGSVDEQTDKLKIVAEYEGTALTYLQSNIDELVNKSIKDVVPESFALSDTKPEYETVASKTKDTEGSLDIQIKLRSYILPKIDNEKIKKELAGVKIPEAEEYLRKVPNVKEIGIVVTPNLPSFIMSMPRVAKNINIVVEKID